jgi:hypothetical protein
VTGCGFTTLDAVKQAVSNLFFVTKILEQNLQVLI